MAERTSTADRFLSGRVTYVMMESAWNKPALARYLTGWRNCRSRDGVNTGKLEGLVTPAHLNFVEVLRQDLDIDRSCKPDKVNAKSWK